jgi:hypothetical protein
MGISFVSFKRKIKQKIRDPVDGEWRAGVGKLRVFLVIYVIVEDG